MVDPFDGEIGSHLYTVDLKAENFNDARQEILDMNDHFDGAFEPTELKKLTGIYGSSRTVKYPQKREQMAYGNNNRQNGGNNYRQNGGNNGGYRNQNNNSGGARPKKSGATFKQIAKGKSTGMMAVNAWYVTRQGLIRISAFGYARADGKNNNFEKAVVTVVNGTGQSTTYHALINISTKRMAIKELGLLVTAAGAGVTSSGKKVRGAVVRLTN